MYIFPPQKKKMANEVIFFFAKIQNGVSGTLKLNSHLLLQFGNIPQRNDNFFLICKKVCFKLKKCYFCKIFLRKNCSCVVEWVWMIF